MIHEGTLTKKNRGYSRLYFKHFILSRQSRNETNDRATCVVCLCVRVSIILKSYISENSMCVLDSLLNRINECSAYIPIYVTI